MLLKCISAFLCLTLSSLTYAQDMNLGPLADWPATPVVREGHVLLLQSFNENLEPIYNNFGQEIGRFDAESIFELSVNPQIFVQKLSQSVEAFHLVGAADNRTRQNGLYEARLETGEQVWVDLDRLIADNALAVVGFESEDQALEDDVVSYLLQAPTDEPIPRGEAKFLSLPQGNRFVGKAMCDCPVGCRVTSGYGKRKARKTKNGKWMSTYHRGIDYGSRGHSVPIIAAADGCINRILTNAREGYGLAMYIKHGSIYQTFYGHMRAFAIRQGCVKKGQTVGYMGQTGNATGIHLHLGVLKSGVWDNPALYVIDTAIGGKCPVVPTPKP